MKTLNDWLAENEKLCQEATPGPWAGESCQIDGSETTFSLESPSLGPRNAFGDSRRFATGSLWNNRDFVSVPDRRDADFSFLVQSRLSLPTALKIIRELAERCGWGDAEYAAEQIINEQ